jgi:hypothetical protein
MPRSVLVIIEETAHVDSLDFLLLGLRLWLSGTGGTASGWGSSTTSGWHADELLLTGSNEFWDGLAFNGSEELIELCLVDGDTAVFHESLD